MGTVDRDDSQYGEVLEWISDDDTGRHHTRYIVNKSVEIGLRANVTLAYDIEVFRICGTGNFYGVLIDGIDMRSANGKQMAFHTLHNAMNSSVLYIHGIEAGRAMPLHKDTWKNDTSMRYTLPMCRRQVENMFDIV